MLPRDSFVIYAAQLAVHESGVAWVCIDPAAPDAQVLSILNDARPRLILTDAAGMNRVGAMSTSVPAIDMTGDVNAAPVKPGDACQIAPVATGTNLAYLIYTSGTTGQPKGVMIQHASVANLVHHDELEFQLTEADRVVQGSSCAYDSSVEEIWLAFAVGATLVVMDDAAVRLGPDLIEWLQRERVTVFCPPPTLLQMTGCEDPASALPDLRLLYVGGEALPRDLAKRWARGRRLENGYGPTECTVTVMRATIDEDAPITIGRPTPGHEAWVMDERGVVFDVDGTVSEGVREGELCISGIGLARGYLRRESETAASFIEHPIVGRLYRTGDRVRRQADGQFEYVGRMDEQVKIRGHRVELTAIDAALSELPGVDAGAAAYVTHGSRRTLVGIVRMAGDVPDFTKLRTAMAARISSHMIPDRFIQVPELPTSIGGKIDRRKLDAIAVELLTRSDHDAHVVSPESLVDESVELRITRAFTRATGTTRPVGLDDDFFTDLGGTSLSAVDVICELRTDELTRHVTTRDLYERRTVRALTRELERTTQSPAATRRSSCRPERPTTRRIRMTTAVQGLWILGGATGFTMTAWVIVFLLAPLSVETFGVLVSAIIAFSIVLILQALALIPAVALTVLAKRVLIRKYEAGRHAVWSSFYLRHWIVTRCASLIPWRLVRGTSVETWILRRLGAQIGHRLHLHHGVDVRGGGWDLLSIGDDVSIARDVVLGTCELDDGDCVFAPIEVGDRTRLDVRAVISGGSTIAPDAVVGPLSWVNPATPVGPGAYVSGVPAAVQPPGRQDVGIPLGSGMRFFNRNMPESVHGAITIAVRILASIGRAVPFAIGVFLVSLWLGISAAEIVSWIQTPQLSWMGAGFAALVLVVSGPVSLACRAIAMRAVGCVRTGACGRWSLAWLRIDFKIRSLESAGRWLSGTMYWPWWLRLAGMRVGSNSEVSTIVDVLPEHVSLGRECFLADGIYLAAPNVDRGVVTMAQTRLGDRSFIGNHVVIPAGSSYPPDILVGVSTVADPARITSGTSWFGHPAMELPNRDTASGEEGVRFSPSLIRRLNRAVWEAARFALPLLPLGLGAGWVMLASTAPSTSTSIVAVFGAALVWLLATLMLGGLAWGCVVALKWALLGRVRPGRHPLWSCWCSRWDFVYVAWQFWARPLLAVFEGTLWLAIFLRMTGMRIGRRVVLGAGFAQVVDPDMLAFGDDATVATMFQAHSFEDRVLKVDHVAIGRGATAMHAGVVFYGVEMGDRAHLAPATVVMKGDRVETDASVEGAPSRPSIALTPSA